MRCQTALRLILFVVLYACHLPSQAQSTQAALSTRLKDKNLYLRGCWGGARLSFDSNGKIVGSASRTSFTLSGFEVTSVELKDGQLSLKGKRVGIAFVDNQKRFVRIGVDDPKIKIAAPPNGDFGPALDAIFSDDLASFDPPLPDYWETWGHKNIPTAYAGLPVSTDGPQPSGGEGAAAETDKPRRVGGNVLPPKLLRNVPAEYAPVARLLKYSGHTSIRLIVDADGRPRHIRIDQPMGLGLDEQAVESVGQYLFKPATENGLPVPVEAAVEVNFQIF